MNAARRVGQPAPSTSAPALHREPVGSRWAKLEPGRPPAWSARLYELESRLRRLESEKRKLREACQQIEAASATQAKLHDFVPVGLVSLDAHGRILSINRTGAALLGCQRGPLLKRRFASLVAPDDSSKFAGYWRRCLRSRQMVSGELNLRRADGARVLVQFASVPVLERGSRVTRLETTLFDITDRRRLEAEVLQISEREQRRIAQDLHDGLGQHLTGIVHLAVVLQASLAERSLPDASDAARIVKLLDDAAAQTRTLARGLHPVQPEARGLMSSLEELAAMVRDLFKIDCRFECPRPVLMRDNGMATHLYRIAQEAVNNAIKHGRATRIRIGMANTSKRITLTVQNNGAAISGQHSSKEGIGLRIMQYRAAMMGGSLVLMSDARRGTKVVCTVHKKAGFLPPSPSQ